MGWGLELWDRTELVEKYTQDNIDFIEKFRVMLTQVAQAELDYAKTIKKIVKSAPPLADTDQSSFAKAYTGLLSAFDSSASHHENISTALANDVAAPLKNVHKTKSGERAALLGEVQRLNAALGVVMANLGKTRKRVEKAEQEAEQAEAAFDKAERSDNVTKARVIQLRSKWVERSKNCDAETQRLVEETSAANSARSLHYYKELPAVLDKLQALDELRADGVVTAMTQVVQCYSSEVPRVVHLFDGARDGLRAHNKGADSALFAALTTAKTPLPGDLPVHEKAAAGGSSGKDGSASPKTSRSEKVTSSSSAGAGASASTAHQTSPTAAAAGGNQSDDDDDGAADPRMSQAIPAIHCRAMYSFAGTSEGELPIAENELLQVLQNDGSGWVLVCNSARHQGYVPESYIALVDPATVRQELLV